MTQVASTIASQIVPLNDDRLVLPNTAIAEIIGYSQPDALPSSVKNAPEWLLGMVAWRGLSVPVITLEQMLGGKYKAPGPHARLAVLNAVAGIANVPFIAVPTLTIPHLMKVDQDAISVIEDTGEKNPAIACHVVVDGYAAVIPDLEEIERQLAEVLGSSGKKNN